MATGAKPYTVKSGDTLWAIAHRTMGHGAMWPVIFVFNQKRDLPRSPGHRLIDPDKIYINQVIYLPEAIDPADLKRGPSQRAIPGPITQTGPAIQPGHEGAGASKPPASRPNPQQAPGAGGGAGGGAGAGQGTPGQGGGLRTLLNDFAVRFDVSRTVLKRKVGQFEVEVQFKGYVALRHDRVVPASTFTNKAYENQRKMELGHSLGDLIATRKLKVEWKTGKIEYECLLTTHMSNGKPFPISTGIALDSSVPPLAWRTKIDLADASGHWRDIIYRAENLTITITVRWKPDPKQPNPPASTVSLVPAVAIAPAATAPAAAPAPAPVPAPVPTPAPAPAPVMPHPSANDPTSTRDTGDHEGEGWLSRQWHWVEHHPLEVAEAVVVVAVVVAAAPAIIAAAPEIAAAIGSRALVQGAVAATAAIAVSRLPPPAPRPGPGV